MMDPVTVICWKWRGDPQYRSTFTAAAVNTLGAMVRRHYAPLRDFVCVTDDPSGIAPWIRIVPLWSTFGSAKSPHGDPRKYPSCYRRLRLFAPDAGDLFGPRFVSVDLDCVITGDLTPLWHRPEEFVIWGDTNPRNLYNGSMFLLRAGSRSQVYESFDPERSPTEALRAGCFGSDQGWISHVLGRGEAMWSRADGVYSFTNYILKQGGSLPDGARIVFFHGAHDPWMPSVQAKYPWVRDYYWMERAA